MPLQHPRSFTLIIHPAFLPGHVSVHKSKAALPKGQLHPGITEQVFLETGKFRNSERPLLSKGGYRHMHIYT